MMMHGTFVGTRLLACFLGATLFGSGKAAADFVIADDLIVQGSTCVGLDCVNNEPFGFDTLRLKENNTRILFMDTSVSSGFPANHWQLTANDSSSGGLNKFSIENITVATIPFTVVGPAPTNSLFVASTGKVGLRTATPLLDLHIATGNTPAFRLEQNSSGGFSAQTWDVGSNEANFFVRDLTGGSRLPFRIRPGAPTSSVDIAASGNIGIGTASPAAGNRITAINASDGDYGILLKTVGGARSAGVARFADNVAINASDSADFINFRIADSEKVRIDASGNVGIGTPGPTARLHTVGTVRFAGVANCGAGIVSNASGDLACLTSSRQFKNVTGDLAPATALTNIMALRPQTGSYINTPDITEHWLIAEEVAAVDPSLVGLSDGKPHVVKTQNVVADLIAVVQQQQRRIEQLEQRLAAR